MIAKNVRTAAQLVEAIRVLWENRSIKRLHEWLEELETEEDYYRLIRLADQADLYKYSNVLSTHAYKRFGTLRPFVWHCTRLLETGKSLEAEERMTARLHGISDSAYTVEEQVAAHSLLFRVFCQLNRMPEAAEQLEKIKEAKGAIWPDLEALYYLHSGEWDKAETILTNALLEEKSERNAYVRQLYADHLSMIGRQEDSLEVLRSAEAAYPEDWGFWMEQVRRLFLLDCLEETIELMDSINAANPYHVHRDYYVFLKAECLYKLEKWDQLDEWIRNHQSVLKNTLYGKNVIQRDAAHKQLKLTPKVQKLDFCVPASLSMMLEAFGKDIDQDEIAAHVFDVTGSKLRTTMKYMESHGLRSQYFKGNVEVYKRMIDAGVPVLLSMLIENNAHVQVVVGYDDRMQALLIQDPNDQSPFPLPYSEMKSAYKMTDSLSMVFVNENQTHLLAELNLSEHRFYEQLYEFLEEEEESEAFIAFLKENIDERYAAVIGISVLFSDEAKLLHETWLEQLRAEFGEDDAELALLAAHLHFQKDELPQALACLTAVNEKNSPFAQFLRGVILINQDSESKAIPHFKRSIELDHYQPSAYSHLARCYLEIGKTVQAYKWSSIALAQLPSDIYVQVTHSLIQYESGAYGKALARFRKLSEEQPEDGYFIYEAGRCLLALGEVSEAIDCFNRYIEMAPTRPYAYLRLAEIYMEAENWTKAMDIVNQGLGESEVKDVLHVYRGHIAVEQKQYVEAEKDYRKALELDPDDLFAVNYIAYSLVMQKRFSDATDLINAYADKGDTGYFLRSATMLWQEWPEYVGQKEAVALLERALVNKEMEGYQDLAQQYAEFGEHPLFRHRVLGQFKELRKASPDEKLMSLEGYLHEQAGNSRFARELYLQAIDRAPVAHAHFQLGLLEVEAENYEEAINQFLRSAELDPANMRAREALMHTYLTIEDQRRAFAAALFILQNDPLELEFNELFELASTEETIETIAKALERVSEQVPEEWLLAGKAQCLEKLGRLEEAEALFEQAKKLNGAFSSRFQYVEFCFRRGQLKRAAAMLELLISEQPEDERLYGEYIRILTQLGKSHEIAKRLKKWLGDEELGIALTFSADELANWFTEAEEEEEQNQKKKGLLKKFIHKAQQLRMISNVFALYDEAALRIPENELPVIRQAAFCLSRGMAKEAVEELKPFVDRTGNYDAAVMLMQATRQLAEDADAPEVLHDALNQAKALHQQVPVDASVLMMWGDTYSELEQTGKALEKYKQIVRLEPFNAEAHMRVLSTLAEHRPEEVEEAIAGIPEEVKIPEWKQLARAMSHLTLKRAAPAHEILAAILAEEKEFPPALYELSRCEMMLGNKGKALQAISELFSIEGGVTYLSIMADEPVFTEIHDEIDELVAKVV